MRVVVTTECRFNRTPDGAVWTQTMFPLPFWQRYLEVFDEVRVVARTNDVPEASPDWLRVDGANVDVSPMPPYVGPLQYLKNLPRLRAALYATVNRNDAVILRVGSPIADLLQPRLRAMGQPYGVEVVGDPWDVFSPGVLRHPLRPLLRWSFTYKLWQQCRQAAAASYVTNEALQARYPVAPGRFSIGVSSIELLPEHFVAAPRRYVGSKRRLRLVLVGTLEQMQKAPDVAIKALARCTRDGLDLELRLVGDGRCRGELEAMVRELGLGDRVSFAGRLTAGEPIRRELDQADVFVLPSRGEGLPRAVIEAMARGLPSIGSHVGGFPELLPAADRVAAGDVEALAAKLREVIQDPARMEEMSRRNLEKARAYLADELQRRRVAFWRELRRITESRSQA
jgi:glycosyltransferase involved in cell wall biosynthesis